jgi:hypothetical protein
MCVSKSPITTFAYNIVVRPVSVDKPGEFPRNPPGTSMFDYPMDTINFPASGKLNRTQDSTALLDPWNVDFCVTPSTEEECVFIMCFEGIDIDTIVGDNYESTDVRCFIFQVSNFVLSFTPTILDSGTGGMVPTDNIWVRDDTVSSTMNATAGYSVSAWVLPRCSFNGVTSAVNRTVVKFVSTGANDGVNDTRSAIMWAESSPEEGAFYYYDDHSGAFMTKQVRLRKPFAAERAMLITSTTISVATFALPFIDMLECT